MSGDHEEDHAPPRPEHDGLGEAGTADAGSAGPWWRRLGTARWTIVLSSVFALAMLAVLVLLAVFRGRAGCVSQSAGSVAPSQSPSELHSGPDTGPSPSGGATDGSSSSCTCGGTTCFDPGEACDRFVNETCDGLVAGCGGGDRGDGGSGTPTPRDGGDPAGTAVPTGRGTADPDTRPDAPGTGDGGPAGTDNAGGGSDGVAGDGPGDEVCDSGSVDCSGCEGCSGSGSSPDCSGYAGASHGVSGSLLIAVPAVLATPGIGARLGIAAVRGYQRWLSPRLAVRCRYTPTCSQYGLLAIERYGLLAGARLALTRIRRCTGGVPPGSPDPVP